MSETDLLDRTPPELVIDYPPVRREVIYENPFDSMISAVHKLPRAFVGPNAFLNMGPSWVFRRTEDMKRVLLDNDAFGVKGNTGMSTFIGETWDTIPTELDPPRHTEVRREINALFTPAKIQQLAPKVRQRAQELVAAFRDRGRCEFVRDFATPYPATIFLDLLGLPQEGMQQFLDWEFDVVHASDLETRAAGVRAVKAYLMAAIDERRHRPTDDLISAALRIEVNGAPLSPIEVFGHCLNLYVGGLDTVTSSLGLHFLHLAQRPDQQDQIRKNPGLARNAVNELSRAYSIVSTYRLCRKEIEIAGVTVKPGERVMTPLPVAGRDPEVYDRPDEVLFDRETANLFFGFGVHRCLGVHLAQRELQCAMEEVLAGIPEFRLAPGARIPFRMGNVIHVKELPLAWN